MSDVDETLEYIEGLPWERLPGVLIPQFQETTDAEVAGHIPQTRHDPAMAKHNRFANITMPSFAFVATNGTALNAPIPFGRANSVRVDNLTSQWCRVAGFYVQPFSYGWMIPLQNATATAVLTWESPATVTQPAATTNANAYTVWYEERFPPTAGLIIGGAATTGSGTATVTSVAIANTSTQVLAANSARKGFSIYADGTLPTNLYILSGGGTASSTNYTVQLSSTLPYFEVPFGFTGAVQHIGSSATGNLRVTEYT